MRHHKFFILFIIFLSFSANADSEILSQFKSAEVLMGARENFLDKDITLAPVTSCRSLNEKFSGDSTSSIQKEREWERYKNKLIPLKGTLQDVDRVPLVGGYLAFFKCVNSSSFIVDYTVKIPSEFEEYAFSLEPGKTYDTYVRLVDYSEMRGVSTEVDYVEAINIEGEACLARLSSIDRSNNQVIYRCKNGFEAVSYENDSDVVVYAIGRDESMGYVFIEGAEYPLGIFNKEGESFFYTLGAEKNCVVKSSNMEEILIKGGGEDHFNNGDYDHLENFIEGESSHIEKINELLSFYLSNLTEDADCKFSQSFVATIASQMLSDDYSRIENLFINGE